MPSSSGARYSTKRRLCSFKKSRRKSFVGPRLLNWSGMGTSGRFWWNSRWKSAYGSVVRTDLGTRMSLPYSSAQVTVRVSEEDVPARALGDRTIAWLTRPSSVRLMDHPQPAVARGVAVQDFAAAVRRPVVDADHVECDTGDVLGGEGVEKHGKEAGLVEDRDDNRDVTPLVHAGIVTPSAFLPWDLNSEPSRCSTRPCQCAPDARGRSWRLITSRVGERRTTSRKPALSYRLRDPKNMKSSWLRSGLSTGYASSIRTPCSWAKSMAPASSLCWWPWPRWLLAT